MNFEKFSSPQRKLLAVFILALLIVVVTGIVALPYNVIVDRYDNKLQRHNEKLEIQRAIVRDGEKARTQQRILDRLEATNGFFLTSDRPALASAELQKRVKQVIEQSGGTVVSSQMLGDKSEQGVDMVVLRVQMRCGVEELQKVFHTLEAQTPILLLDNILLGARPAGSIVPGRGRESSQQLDIRFDVTGFRPVEAIHEQTAIK